jgi:hypothetical protein
MNSITEKITAHLSHNLTNNLLITGGHFLVNGDILSQVNEGTIASFETAASVYTYAKKGGYKVGLGVLLNDIGMVCGGSDHCHIVKPKKNERDSFVLPDSYKQILRNLDIPETEVHIFWEKHIRNRGKKLFNKIKKIRSDVKNIDGDYYLEDTEGYGNILLLRKMKNDKYGTPACPLIMAAYAFEQERAQYRHSMNLYYIDEENVSNIPSHVVIEKGKRVAEILGSQSLIQNIYFTKNEVLTNF